MTRFDYQLRGLLYFLLAVIPIITAGMQAHLPPVYIVLGATLAGGNALRAYIDTSPADRNAAKAAEQSAAVGAIDSAPPITPAVEGAGTGG